MSRSRPKSLSKQISLAVDLLNKESYKGSYVALYSIIKDLVEVPEKNPATQCHAGLNRAGCEDSLAVVSSISRGREHPWFYRWLIDRSPWRSCFIRRAEWSLKNQCVVVTTDAPSNLMRGALFATRIWEYAPNVSAMGELRRTVPLEMLYPILTMLRKGRSGGELGLTTSYGGHFPFYHMVGKTTLKNFVNHKVIKPSLPYKLVGIKGAHVNETFGGDDGGAWLHNQLLREYNCVQVGLETTAYCKKSDMRKFLLGVYKSLKEG